jgi:hypothetical protein
MNKTMPKDSPGFIYDYRPIYLEQRSIRDGNAIIFQGRGNTHNPDGSVEYGEWSTIGSCSNWGEIFGDCIPSQLDDCFGPQPTFLQQLKRFFF